jgi:hypothetical protein
LDSREVLSLVGSFRKQLPPVSAGSGSAHRLSIFSYLAHTSVSDAFNNVIEQDHRAIKSRCRPIWASNPIGRRRSLWLDLSWPIESESASSSLDRVSGLSGQRSNNGMSRLLKG